MRTIELNAEGWDNRNDFYNALLAAIGAPEWHGNCTNALIDSMIWGGINELEPPYRIRICGVQNIPGNVREEIQEVSEALSRGRQEYKERRGDDVNVSIEIGP